MSNTLATVTLHEQTQWIGLSTYAPVEMSSRRTLAGRWHYSTRGRTGGRPIVLEVADRVAWLTQTQVETLRTLASDADAVYTLTWGGTGYSVVFDHEAGDPVDFRPIWPFNTYWTGTIRLREVAA